MLRGHAYKISVIMPIYNVGRYLEEAIDSVVGQTIGFEDNVQLILVNDGSSDDTEVICLRYLERFPGNVVYTRQENAGVAVARNRGLQEAHGECVCFLSGDDRWETDAFAKGAAFLERHPDIDMAAARIVFFEARTGYHPTDFKFRGGEVVSIHEEPERIHIGGVAFLRRSALSGRSYDARLRQAEDFAFIEPLIMAKGYYGVVKDAIFWYRRRSTKDSLVDTFTRSRSWYFDVLELCHTMLFDLSRKQFGSVIPYLQHCVMYDLQTRLKARISDDMTDEDVARYRALIAGLLADISDDVIFAQRQIHVEHKLYALALKSGKSVTDIMRGLRIEDGVVYHNAIKVRDLARGQRLVVEVLEFDGDSLRAEGYIISVLERSAISLEFDVEGKRVEAQLTDRPDGCKSSLGEVIIEPVGFIAVIPLREDQAIKAVIGFRGFEIEPSWVYGPHARLTESMRTSYFEQDGWFATRRGKGGIRVVRDRRPFALLRRERRFLGELVAEKKRRDLASLRVLHLLMGRPLPLE